MFDIKVYDENGERETIRDLSWIQMTSVQQVLSRLHFALGRGKHYTKQVSDDSIIDVLKERISELEAQLAEADAVTKPFAELSKRVDTRGFDYVSLDVTSRSIKSAAEYIRKHGGTR